MNSQQAPSFQNLRVCVVSPFLPRPGGVSVQAELLCRFLEREGAVVHRVNTDVPLVRGLPLIGRWLLPLAQVIAVFLRLLAAAPRSDIIHVQAASYWAFFLPVTLAQLVAWIFRRPLVMSYFGGKASLFMARWQRWTLPMFRRMQGFTVPSHFLQEVFRHYGLNPAVIPSVIDMERWPFQAHRQWPPLIMWMRSLSANANPAMALRAFALVRETVPEARLLMIGRGPLAGLLRELAQELNVAQAVSHTSWLPAHRLRRAMQTASVFWNTTSYDNFPLSLIEAAASGTVIVSTDVGGISELLENGVDGLLVQPDDHETMAAATIQVLRRPVLASGLADNAREVAERYTWSGIRGDIAALYGRAPQAIEEPAPDDTTVVEAANAGWAPGGMVARTEYLLSEGQQADLS